MKKTAEVLNIEELKISCQGCSLADLCMPHGMHADEITQLDKSIKRLQPIQTGQHLFQTGDRSHAIYAVKSGILKSYTITVNGDEQVLGFALPGELVGLDGLAGEVYSSNSVALETSSICELPLHQLERLCHEYPSLQKQMMRLVGKEITADQNQLTLLGQRNAEERLAAFLLDLSRRFDDRGISADEFNLPMSRQDIGNYLGLAIETVSRLFAHLQDIGILRVNRKQIRIIDHQKLKTVLDGRNGSVCKSA